MNKNQKATAKSKAAKKANPEVKKELVEEPKPIVSSGKPRQKSVPKKSASQQKPSVKENPKKIGDIATATSTSLKKKNASIKKEPAKEEKKPSKKSPQIKVVKSVKKKVEKPAHKVKQAPKPAAEEEVKKEKIEKPAPKANPKRQKEPAKKAQPKAEEVKPKEEPKPKEEIKKEAPKKASDPQVSKEIEEIIKKIEDRKKQKGDTFVGKKRARQEKEKTNLKFTAKDYGFVLQKNPNFKKEHLIDITALGKKKVVSTTEMILALLEIAHNSDYYQLAYSNKSKLFWEDILKYKVLYKIFEGYKGETLRKYWRTLSKFDVNKIKAVLEKHKEFFGSITIKMLTVVNAVALYLDGQIQDIEKHINGMLMDVRKQEIFQEEYQDPVTGLVTTVRDVRTTVTHRRRFEPGHKKEFVPNSAVNKQLDEIFDDDSANASKYQRLIQSLNEENNNLMKYLKVFNEQEKKKFSQINEDDKFAFKVIDLVIENFAREFPNVSKDFILEILIATSMDIVNTYRCLVDENARKKLSFTAIEDEIILKMKGKKDYQQIVKEKGERLVNKRESFLKS